MRQTGSDVGMGGTCRSPHDSRHFSVLLHCFIGCNGIILGFPGHFLGLFLLTCFRMYSLLFSFMHSEVVKNIK